MDVFTNTITLPEEELFKPRLNVLQAKIKPASLWKQR